MRFSEAFIPTLKEAPSDATSISHKLMVRAGMIRQTAAGVYSYLPYGYNVIQKMKAIVREEMNRAGGQEFLLPALQPTDIWERTGRLEAYGQDVFRFDDRHGHEMLLGPTHEEVITSIVASDIRSWADLPKLFYQIQTKFRDEARPRFGVLRTREFTMKDLYSFDADEAGLDKSYQKMFEAYCRIFERVGVAYEPLATAETGAIGGSASHEFIVLADSGEDHLVKCPKCGFSALLGETVCVAPATEPNRAECELKIVSTPGMTRVEQVAGFLKTKPHRLIKTMILEKGDGGLLAALIRGDHELNMSKLMGSVDDWGLKLASAERIAEATGGPVGFSGPIGLSGITVLADLTLKGETSMVVGANKEDAHYVGCEVGRDFTPDSFCDLRKAVEGDLCPKCSETLKLEMGIEVGHIFKLGTRYSEKLGATFSDASGKENPVIMGCYGLGIERTVAAVIEQSHDERGIILPKSLAPYQAIILPMQAPEGELVQLGEKCYNLLKQAGVDVLLDDRNVWPGVKFADADLIGVPTQIVLGKRGLKEGRIEIVDRRTKEKTFLPIDVTADSLRDAVAG
ncbi:proline--tRNA ligase [bacterium]|nr:proline--tRNA ligase [bacterium]